MTIKDTIILLIFFLSVLGLLIGIYCTEDVNSEKSHEKSYEKLYGEDGDIITVILEKTVNKTDLSKFFTWKTPHHTLYFPCGKMLVENINRWKTIRLYIIKLWEENHKCQNLSLQ